MMLRAGGGGGAVLALQFLRRDPVFAEKPEPIPVPIDSFFEIADAVVALVRRGETGDQRCEGHEHGFGGHAVFHEVVDGLR
jgi:hypothetical protein